MAFYFVELPISSQWPVASVQVGVAAMVYLTRPDQTEPAPYQVLYPREVEALAAPPPILLFPQKCTIGVVFYGYDMLLCKLKRGDAGTSAIEERMLCVHGTSELVTKFKTFMKPFERTRVHVFCQK